MDFSKLKVMVVGEVGLDVFEYGTSTRRSPEADVPVISEIRTVSTVGMAGNLADQLTLLGAQVRLFTVLGKGSSTNASIHKRMSSNVTYVVDLKYRTPRKTRLVCDGKPLARIDKETTHKVSAKVQREFLRMVREEMPKYDAVFLQDYGKGLWDFKSLWSVLKAANSRKIPVFVDPYSKQEPAAYEGAFFVKPNLKEAREMVPSAAGIHPRDLATVVASLTGAEYAVVTLGASGVVYSDRQKSYCGIEAPAVRAVDVSGAGDTFMAVAGLSILSGVGLHESLERAARAGAIVVQKERTAHVTLEELK